MSKDAMPAKGGSYVKKPGGDLERVAHTKPKDLAKPEKAASKAPSKET